MSVSRMLAGLMLAISAATPVSGWAVDAIGVEGGQDDENDISRGGIESQWYWGRQWFTQGDWYLGGLWEVSATYWSGDKGTSGNDWLFDFGITPVLRYARHTPLGLLGIPYVEFGVGPHVFSENEIQDEDYTINFAFGSYLGAGIQFGSRNQWELGYRFQHLSNADLGEDNPGIDFHLVRLGYRF